MNRKPYTAVLAILLVLSACNTELFDIPVKTAGRAVVYIDAEPAEAEGRSVLPSSLDSDLRYELWGSVSGEKTKLKDFTALSNAAVELALGVWNFTLKAYKETVLVLEGEKQEIRVSSDTANISFDLSPAAADGKGSLDISVSVPNAKVYGVTGAELTIDGAEGIPLAVVDNKIAYHCELSEGDFLAVFSLKYKNGTTCAVISEIVVIRPGWTSKKQISMSWENINKQSLNRPTNLNASDWRDNILTFTWIDNSNNETGFVLNDGTRNYEIPAGSTSYGIPLTVPPVSAVTYELKAINNYGESDAVSCIIAAPGKPQGLNASAQSSGKITVSWQEAASGVLGYNVYRSESPEGAYTRVGEESITAASYIDTDVAPLSGYYYKIKAVNMFGEGDFSDSVYAATPAVSVPVNLNVTSRGQNSISLSWNCEETSYKIYRASSQDGVYTEAGTSGVTNYTDTGLAPSTAYYYKISAITSSGHEGGYSEPVEAITDAPPPLPPPDRFWVFPVSSGGIRISWDSVPEARGYTIYKAVSATGGNLNFSPIASNISGTTYIDTSATNPAVYYYTIAAINSENVTGLQSGFAQCYGSGAITALPDYSNSGSYLKDSITATGMKYYRFKAPGNYWTWVAWGDYPDCGGYTPSDATADILVYGYWEDTGEIIFAEVDNGDSYWSDDCYFYTAVDRYVIVEVYPYNSGSAGTFYIKYGYE
jgi:fibronectin type 3 domain-containing protein